MIRSGRVLFPKQGSEVLRKQLVYFGVEKYDDLVDAFTIVLHMALEIKHCEIQIIPRWQLGI